MTTTAAELQDLRPNERDTLCNRLFDFLQTAGRSRYDESVTQLEHGLPMTPVEIAAFQRRPHHQLAVQLRRWDDDGKVAGAHTPPLEHWRPANLSLLLSA
jgi:predicted HD phosphohydrolase